MFHVAPTTQSLQFVQSFEIVACRQDIGDHIGSVFAFDDQCASIAAAPKVLHQRRKIHCPLTHRHFTPQLTRSFRRKSVLAMDTAYPGCKTIERREWLIRAVENEV